MLCRQYPSLHRRRDARAKQCVEIAASWCIEQQGKRRFRNPCAGNTHFKKRMCEVMVRSGTRSGTVDECVRDPSFKGSTVERGGVGG